MAKKKSARAMLEKMLARPWCYYCERDFDDLKVLISHQRAQHFKCEKCGKRLNTAGGLVIHVQQVHKESINQVFNAIKGREKTDIEIFGLEGIPESAIKAHEDQIHEKYAKASESPVKSTLQIAAPYKRPKVSSVNRDDILVRLAAHRAARAASESTGSTTTSDPSMDSAPNVSTKTTSAPAISS
ncbi:hypothetical protein V1511DRAFT_516535 [Dipodascopsis uninucleata]